MTQALATEEPQTLKGLLATPMYKKKFEDMLGARRGAQFISSIITVSNGSNQLQQCEPNSIISAAAQAATLDLSINPSIGQAAIVPFRQKGVYKATFQIMKGGIKELAHRSGKYLKIRLVEIFEGELISWNRFDAEIVFDATKKKSDKVMGFYFFFHLKNGFVHKNYWSVQECIDHGWKYSKSFKLWGNGLWMEDPLIPKKKVGNKFLFDQSKFKGLITHKSGCYAMCAKTVSKNDIKNNGPLSADMLDAFTADQATIGKDGKPDYIDTTSEPIVVGTEDGDLDKTTPKPQPAAKTNGKKPDTKPAGDKGGEATDDPNAQKETIITVDRVGKTTSGEGKDEKEVWKITAKSKVVFFTENEKVAEMAKGARDSDKKLKVTYLSTPEGNFVELLENA